MDTSLSAGQILARGVRRHLRRGLNFQSLEEFVPVAGMRTDIFAIGPKGEIWIVECKSSRADFRSDSKWQNYLDYCDQFFWAVDSRFPHELLPKNTGLIFADQHDAEIIRWGQVRQLAAARRRRLTLKFARNAADRHQSLARSMEWDRFRLRSGDLSGD